MNCRLSTRPDSETKYYYVDRPAISIFLGLLTAAPPLPRSVARSAASRIVLTSESGMDLRPDYGDRTPHLAIVRICFLDPRTLAVERFPCQRREAKCHRSSDGVALTAVGRRVVHGGKWNTAFTQLFVARMKRGLSIAPIIRSQTAGYRPTTARSYLT